jgi:hypothetical protein
MSMTTHDPAAITPDDVGKVWDLLKAKANAKKLVYLGEIDRLLGREIFSSQYHLLLDPIYEETKIKLRKADLSCIVVRKEDGYPVFFSDGGPARSRRFNPDDPQQLKRWLEEVERVFSTPW